MIQPNAGDAFKVEFQCGDLPPVAFNDDVLFASNTNRIVKAIFEDAFLDLLDIVRSVLPGVVLIRREIARGKVYDFQWFHFDLPFLTF